MTKPNSNSSSICTHGCSGNLTEECGGYGNGNDYYSVYALASNIQINLIKFLYLYWVFITQNIVPWNKMKNCFKLG